MPMKTGVTRMVRDVETAKEISRNKGLNKENADDIYSKIQKDYGGADLLTNSSK